MLPFDYEVASVSVDADRQDSPPKMIRMRYHIEIITEEPDQRVNLLHRNIRKSGTITNTLAGAWDLTGDIVAHPTERATTARPQEEADDAGFRSAVARYSP